MRRIRVYTASRLDELDHWRRLAVEWPEMEFTARWVRDGISYAVEATTSNARLTRAWTENVEDVSNSDAVLVAPPTRGNLRGALVEVGVAIALRKYIVLVGDCPDYGTWQHHPLVAKVSSWPQAREYLHFLPMTFADDQETA